MSGLGNYGANMSMAQGVNAGPAANAHAGVPAGCGCGPVYGYSSTGAILVLFILLVIIARTIYV